MVHAGLKAFRVPVIALCHITANHPCFLFALHPQVPLITLTEVLRNKLKAQLHICLLFPLKTCTSHNPDSPPPTTTTPNHPPTTLPCPPPPKHTSQVPLITLTEVLRNKLKADTFGNMVFWVSFCVFGQPMCLVL
jgi:hypothetical protein